MDYNQLLNAFKVQIRNPLLKEEKEIKRKELDINDDGKKCRIIIIHTNNYIIFKIILSNVGNFTYESYKSLKDFQDVDNSFRKFNSLNEIFSDYFGNISPNEIEISIFEKSIQLKFKHINMICDLNPESQSIYDVVTIYSELIEKIENKIKNQKDKYIVDKVERNQILIDLKESMDKSFNDKKIEREKRLNQSNELLEKSNDTLEKIKDNIENQKDLIEKLKVIGEGQIKAISDLENKIKNKHNYI